MNNLLLILAQRPPATMVAGFRQWQAMGRQVRRGEKSIKIFGYREKKAERADDADESADDDMHVLPCFPTLSVFDVAQTEPIEGADPLPEDPTHRLVGSADHGVIAPLTTHLEMHGWSIQRARLRSASGYTDPESHRVILAENLPIEQAAKSLIHEIAHIEMLHIDDADEYRAHRGRMEVEAESTAFIVAGLTGFDTSAYSIGYIAGWANEDLTVIRGTAGRVLETAHAIVEIIEHAA